MHTVKTSIIPTRPTFAKLDVPHEIHKKAICVFTALGFFLDRDTYYKDSVVLPPASINTIDENGFLIASKPWFSWHYSPNNHSFQDNLNNFTQLFEEIIAKQAKGKKNILPLSGGLDSRSQAVALSNLGCEVTSYSYQFQGGFQETNIAKKIAEACHFPFKKFTIPKGYLWNSINDLASINGCYTDFTHPRQMAVIDSFKTMGNTVSLGHWGDVLFDHTVTEQLTREEEIAYVLKKVIKKGGQALAESLWDSWNLEGSFITYLQDRIARLLDGIEISNSSAKIRAFKSMYWAPRWTAVNLAIFERDCEICLPYFDDSMCQFICTVPELFLANRKLQIEYIKQQNPEVAKILWQAQRPFNLYKYHKNKSPYNVPYRVYNKLKSKILEITGHKLVKQNWELQFLGKENDTLLKKQLHSPLFSSFVSREISTPLYNQFTSTNSKESAHAVSMLLTLSLWYTTIHHESKN